MSRRAGVVALKVNGNPYDVKGSVTYSLGQLNREAIVGHNRVHGFRELPTVPFCEGELTDSGGLDLEAFANITDANVTLELNNGKVISFNDAWSVNTDGLQVTTEEGEVSFRFEALSAEEVL